MPQPGPNAAGGKNPPKGLAGSQSKPKGPVPAPNPQRNPLQVTPQPAASENTARAQEALSDLIAAKVERELQGGPIGAAKGTSQTSGGYAGYIPLWGGGY